MPQCRNCGEKWDLSDEYESCPACGNGMNVHASWRAKALFWAVGILVLGAILFATTCSR
jgi:predicted amidophosphoribosyltransferase